MSRLTEWMQEEHRAIPRMDLRSNGYEKCATRLAEYEDTGFPPEQVQQLKERDTAKRPIKTKGLKDFNGNVYKVVGKCPNCGCGVNSMMKFCDECGQRLDWSERR